MSHVRNYLKNLRNREWSAIALLGMIGGLSLAVILVDTTPETPLMEAGRVCAWIIAVTALGVVAVDLATGCVSRWAAAAGSDVPASSAHEEYNRLMRESRSDLLSRYAPITLTATNEIVRCILRGTRDAPELHRTRRNAVYRLLQKIEQFDLSEEEVRAMFQNFDAAGYADVIEERYGRLTFGNVRREEKIVPTLLDLARAPSRLVPPEMLEAWNASKLGAIGLA